MPSSVNARPKRQWPKELSKFVYGLLWALTKTEPLPVLHPERIFENRLSIYVSNPQSPTGDVANDGGTRGWISWWHTFSVQN